MNRGNYIAKQPELGLFSFAQGRTDFPLRFLFPAEATLGQPETKEAGGKHRPDSSLIIADKC